jgi:hypothetical protein
MILTMDGCGDGGWPLTYDEKEEVADDDWFMGIWLCTMFNDTQLYSLLSTHCSSHACSTRYHLWLLRLMLVLLLPSPWTCDKCSWQSEP